VCGDRPLILEPLVRVSGAAAECLQLLPEGLDEVEALMPARVRVEDMDADSSFLSWFCLLWMTN
jgi:hypothetical protein